MAATWHGVTNGARCHSSNSELVTQNDLTNYLGVQ